MTPQQIKEKEDLFFIEIKNGTSKEYSLKKETVIDNDITVYSIRPNHNSYYYNKETKKKSICLHFTVGYIKSDIATLCKENNHVSVSYVIDRNGRIYELFSDSLWSYHLGKGAIGGNSTMSERSIGIEISNYGPLTLLDNKLIDSYKNTYCGIDENEFYEKKDFRGKSYYATASYEQINATACLIKYLCKKHNIKLEFTPDDSLFDSDKAAKEFNGIFMHSNVRKDKFDWPNGQSILAIKEKCLKDTSKNCFA